MKDFLTAMILCGCLTMAIMFISHLNDPTVSNRDKLICVIVGGVAIGVFVGMVRN